MLLINLLIIAPNKLEYKSDKETIKNHMYLAIQLHDLNQLS